jgi:hypothetical protein
MHFTTFLKDWIHTGASKDARDPIQESATRLAGGGSGFSRNVLGFAVRFAVG